MRAVVTGVSRGIGRSICLRLAHDALKRGDQPRIVATATGRSDDVHRVVAELRSLGAQARACIADLADEDAPARIIGTALDFCGGLDALVSNAGISVFGTLQEIAPEKWDRMFHVNVKAPLLLARAAHDALSASRGSICAVASSSAELVSPHLTGYSSSKAALVMLVQQMAYEWGPDGIRANCVSPGITRSRSTEVACNDEGSRGYWEARLPLRRVAESDEVAAAVAFLIGPDGRYVTGENLRVDGGLHHLTMEYMLIPGKGWGK
jgi:glucose 1-dehydrogenase